MVPAGSVALAERPQGSQATPLDANDSSAAPLRPATPPAVVGIETAAHPTATPPASLPGLFDRPAHSSGSPRAGGAPSTLGYGAPAPASPSSARQVAATAGIGRRKRKPVPRPLDEDDAQISPSEGSPKGASGLDRQLSVLGELPKQFSDCPLQRAQARADAAAESEPLAEVENDGNGLGLGLGSDDGETAQAAVGQAEKKKVLVGATYMTDTANVRWNSALAEITQALAADGQEADKSNGGAAKGKGNDDEEDFEQAMQQADAVLSRLGHDV